MAAIKKHVLKFRFRNETPGTFRYEELDENGKAKPLTKATVGSLYFRKDQVGDNPGNIVTATFAFES